MHAANRLILEPCHGKRPFGPACTHARQHLKPSWRPGCMRSADTATVEPPSTTNAAAAVQLWKNGVYEVEQRVRDYELDQFNVVNNAVYASYCQHARHEALAALGVGLDVGTIQRSGTLLALSELQLTFKAPLRSQDDFRVLVWVEKVTPARLVVGHRVELIRPGPGSRSQAQDSSQAPVNPVAVVEAFGTVVWLDAQYRPIKIPAEARQVFQDLMKARAEAQQVQ